MKSTFLSAILKDCLTSNVQRPAPWNVLFAYDVAVNGETSEEVEERLEEWRSAMEVRGMKVSRGETEYLCMGNQELEREVRMQSEPSPRVQLPWFNSSKRWCIKQGSW